MGSNGFVFGECSSQEHSEDKITRKNLLLTAGQDSSEVETGAFLEQKRDSFISEIKSLYILVPPRIACLNSPMLFEEVHGVSGMWGPYRVAGHGWGMKSVSASCSSWSSQLLDPPRCEQAALQALTTKY